MVVICGKERDDIEYKSNGYNTPVFVWEFRANEDVYEDEFQLINFLKEISKKFVFQLEKSDSGYIHWQGRISLIKKRRHQELMKLMKGIEMPVPNYLRPTLTKEHQNVAFYCMKVDTRVRGPFQDSEEEEVFIPDYLVGAKLNVWQTQFIQASKKINRRQIMCLVDYHGNIGKSFLARYCLTTSRSYLLPSHADGVKLEQSFCNMLMTKEDRNPEYLFLDLPKATNKKLEGIFSCIERISDGFVCDERNVYKQWAFNAPKIVIFSNSDIDTTYLSKDRWLFYEVKNKVLYGYGVDNTIDDYCI